MSADSLSLWTGELGKCLPVLFQRGRLRLESKEVVPPGHDDQVEALAVSPDSKWAASGSCDFTIILWDASNRMMAQRWAPARPYYIPVSSLAFSPDSRYLVSGCTDGKVALWDLIQGHAHKVAMLDGHTQTIRTCAWSPDGNTIATGSEDKTAQLWDAHTFRQLSIHRRFEGRVACLAFSPNGRWLACGSPYRECCAFRVLDVKSGAVHKSLTTYPVDLRDHWLVSHTLSDYPTVAAFDPESKRLAIAPAGSFAGIVVIDVKTGRRLSALKSEGRGFMNALSFSPNGKLLLGVPEGTDSGSETVCIWDASTGAKVLQLIGHTKSVRRACFSPCGRYIVSASEDRTVRLWRTGDGSCVATFSEHKDCVKHVAFSPDGKTLSSGAKNGSVVIRRLHDIIADDSRRILPQHVPAPRAYVDRIINAFRPPDGRARLSPGEKVDPEERCRMGHHEKVFGLRVKKQRIEGDPARGSDARLRKLIARAFPRRDQEFEGNPDSTSKVIPMAVDKPPPIVVSTSSATPTEREGPTRAKRGPSREAQECAEDTVTAKAEVQVEAGVDAQCELTINELEENAEGPASAASVADDDDEPPLETNGEAKAETSKQASPPGAVQHRRERPEEIPDDVQGTGA